MKVAIEEGNRSEQVCFTFRVLLLFSCLFIRNRKTQEDSGGTGGPGRTQVDWPGRSGRYWLGLGSGSSSGGAGARQEPELSPEPGSLTCFSSFSFVSSGPSSTLRHPGNSRETCKVTLSIYCSEGRGGPTGPPPPMATKGMWQQELSSVKPELWSPDQNGDVMDFISFMKFPGWQSERILPQNKNFWDQEPVDYLECWNVPGTI